MSIHLEVEKFLEEYERKVTVLIGEEEIKQFLEICKDKANPIIDTLREHKKQNNSREYIQMEKSIKKVLRRLRLFPVKSYIRRMPR
jgi:uncharacterized alpha/beta hydrolase family protein